VKLNTRTRNFVPTLCYTWDRNDVICYYFLWSSHLRLDLTTLIYECGLAILYLRTKNEVSIGQGFQKLEHEQDVLTHIHDTQTTCTYTFP